MCITKADNGLTLSKECPECWPFPLNPRKSGTYRKKSKSNRKTEKLATPVQFSQDDSREHPLFLRDILNIILPDIDPISFLNLRSSCKTMYNILLGKYFSCNCHILKKNCLHFGKNFLEALSLAWMLLKTTSHKSLLTILASTSLEGGS